MLKKLQNLAKREASGALSGKQLAVGSKVVKVDRLLGEGGFATIYRCTDVDSGAVYALKHFILTGYPDAERDAATEVGVMEALAGCPSVVRLHEAAFGGPPGAPPTSAFALMDFCPDTLPAFLQQRSWRLDDYQLLRVALAVGRAVAALHSLQPPLAHRDLKAENVLLGPGGQWVLCDFGSVSARAGVLDSARDIALEEEVVRRYTTPAYRAPELYDLYAREYIGLPVDIWALGVLLYLLAFGRLPFEGEAKLQVLNGRYVMPEGRPEPLRALIRDCLTVNPRQRPTIHQVLARLEALAPPDLLAPAGNGGSTTAQQQQLAAAAGAPVAAPGAAAGGGGSAAQAPPLHSRVPSQGWADFGSDVGSAASPVSGDGGSAPHSRRHSGSLASWATFSPKRAAEVVAGAASAVAAGAGSFWSSFGEEAPSEAQEQPLVAAQLLQQEEQEDSAAAAAATPASRSQAAQQAPPVQPQRQPMPSAPAPRQQQPAGGAAPAEVSPLSAGLARMTLGGAPAMPAPAAAALPQQAPVPAARAAPAPGPAAAVPPARSEGQGSGASDEVDMLREHCRVLEQLLEEKTQEVSLLRHQAEQQAAEIRALRQRAQQAEAAAARATANQASSQRASAAPAATPAAAASTPSSSRVGVDVSHLQVPDSGDSWISFGGGSGGQGRDAPTPTLLQPATGSSFRGSSAASTAAGPAATPAPSHPGEEALRARLDLSSSSLAGVASARGSAGLVVGPRDDPLRPPPMRDSSGTRLAGAGSGTALGGALSGAASGLSSTASGGGSSGAATNGGLRSFPVQLTPGASPLAGEGSRSAPPSAKPSPIRGSLAEAGSGSGSPLAQPSSPRHSRPASSLSGRSLSPSKGHRRNLTAPGAGFFEELDPLGPQQGHG